MTAVALLGLTLVLASWALVRAVNITHTLVSNWTNGATTLSASVTLTGQLEVNVAEVVPTSTTNQQVTNFAFTLAKLQSIYILSDQACTIKTNSSGAPQETLTIAANSPFAWYTGSGVTVPFAGNVTTIFITTGSIPASANISIKSLVISP